MKTFNLKSIILFLFISLAYSCSEKEEHIPPQILNTIASNISYYSAEIKANLSLGNVDITKISVEYTEKENRYKKEIQYTGSENVSIKLDNLKPNTTYRYKTCVQYDNTSIYSNEISFNTLAIPLGQIKNLTYSGLSQNSVMVKIDYTCPEEFPMQNISINVIEDCSGSSIKDIKLGEDSVLITELKPNTYYTIKALLSNEGGVIESEGLSIQTLTLNGKWDYLFADNKGRAFPVIVSDSNDNIYFGMGCANGGSTKDFNDWNMYDGATTTSLAPYPGELMDTRNNTAFCIGKYIYVVNSNFNVWCYDIEKNSWKKKNDFTRARITSLCVSHKGKGYYGFGIWAQSDFWEYTPETDSWKQLQDCPIRIDRGVMWAIGDYIYAGLDCNKTGQFYRYSIINDSWERIADFPGKAYDDVQFFSIGNKGYFAGGSDGSSESPDYMLLETWEYNTFNNTWTRKSDLPYYKVWGTACTYKDCGVVGDGLVSYGGGNAFKGFILFDPNKE